MHLIFVRKGRRRKYFNDENFAIYSNLQTALVQVWDGCDIMLTLQCFTDWETAAKLFIKVDIIIRGTLIDLEIYRCSYSIKIEYAVTIVTFLESERRSVIEATLVNYITQGLHIEKCHSTYNIEIKSCNPGFHTVLCKQARANKYHIIWLTLIPDILNPSTSWSGYFLLSLSIFLWSVVSLKCLLLTLISRMQGLWNRDTTSSNFINRSINYSMLRIF